MNPINCNYGELNTKNETSSSDGLQFFNYHEYIIRNYDKLQQDTNGKAIVINHFINNHAPVDSARYKTTRIVRVPRTFHTLELSDIIPQFSNIFPGKEAAALHGDETAGFHPIGNYDHNLFGECSITPLVPDKLPYTQFQDIVNTVNDYLYQAFNPYGFVNSIESVLDILSGTLYSNIVNKFMFQNNCNRKLTELDNYLYNVSEKYKSIRFISPKRTGFMSFDIEILKP